jgi:hypothetical protein
MPREREREGGREGGRKRERKREKCERARERERGRERDRERQRATEREVARLQACALARLKGTLVGWALEVLYGQPGNAQTVRAAGLACIPIATASHRCIIQVFDQNRLLSF